MSEKTLDYYMARPYPIEIRADGDGRWRASVPFLPGCEVEAETRIAALEKLEVAKAQWFQRALDEGREIPGPGRYCEC
jgi:predicted RNase H-like HicB family nuclease